MSISNTVVLLKRSLVDDYAKEEQLKEVRAFDLNGQLDDDADDANFSESSAKDSLLGLASLGTSLEQLSNTLLKQLVQGVAKMFESGLRPYTRQGWLLVEDALDVSELSPRLVGSLKKLQEDITFVQRWMVHDSFQRFLDDVAASIDSIMVSSVFMANAVLRPTDIAQILYDFRLFLFPIFNSRAVGRRVRLFDGVTVFYDCKHYSH